MRRALVYSIPGSGTRFASYFIEHCLHYRLTSVESMLEAPEGVPVYSHLHVTEHGNHDRLNRTQRDDGLRTVIPLRNPVAQYLTRRRNHPVGVVEDRVLEWWRALRETIDRYDAVLLPIEEDFDKERRLRLVAAHLEAPPDERELRWHVKHWRKVGSTGPKSANGIDVSFLDDDIAWYMSRIADYARRAA